MLCKPQAMFVPRRLDKYLRDSTALSLVEIRNACREGRVTVRTEGSGQPLAGLSDTLVFEGDVVVLDGTAVIPREVHNYLVFNKPRHVTSTASDPTHRADLRPWLQKMPEGVFPVGRLDRETSGALLFTDDGDFANAVLQPDHHTMKLYWLWLDESLPDDDPRLEALVRGVAHETSTELLQAVSAVVHHRTPHTTELHVTLDEGKNRQIRKMCHLLQLRLLQLHRKAIGTLHIEALALGEWRRLTGEEVAALWQSCGGVARISRTKVAALARMAEAAAQSGRALPRLETWLAHNHTSLAARVKHCKRPCD